MNYYKFLVFVLISNFSITGNAGNQIIINNNDQLSSSEMDRDACKEESNQDDRSSGVYYQKNPQGGTDTIYRTDNKKSYSANQGCNNNQVPVIISPQVYSRTPLNLP